MERSCENRKLLSLDNSIDMNKYYLNKTIENDSSSIFNYAINFLMTSDAYHSFKCGVASFLANYVVGFFHPLELIKTRLQSHDGKPKENIVPKYDGIIRAFKDIYCNEGIKGLYKGLHFNIFSQALANGLFFYLYEKRKQQYEVDGKTKAYAVTVAGLEAGALATIITQPMWVIKTRILLNTDPKVTQVQNVLSKFKEIFKQNGLKGYFKGLSLSLVLSLNGTLQMTAYEGCKFTYKMLGIPESGYLEKNFICGSFSKLMITFVNYPLTTIRTRIQQDQFFNNRTEAKYKSITEITTKIWKEEGTQGFFKGLGANLLRGLPHRGIYFYSYELFKKLLINNIEQK